MSPSDWVALAAVGVSGLAVVFGWLIARGGIKGQRDIAADERIWQRRADTYVDLLEWCQRVSYISVGSEGYDDELTYPPERLLARAMAFASPTVYNQLDYIRQFHMRRVFNHNHSQRKPDPDRDATLTERFDEFKQLVELILALSLSIREDLASDKAAAKRARYTPERPPLPDIDLAGGDSSEAGQD